jgi:hypothetical protein
MRSASRKSISGQRQLARDVHHRNTCLSGCVDHLGYHIAQQAHNLAMVGDEAHLGVQGDTLVEMPRRVVRLGAKDRCHLVHALEDADHDLLVELWALRQVGLLPQVVDAEDVGAPLRVSPDELRSLDLDKALASSARRKPRVRAAAAAKTTRCDGCLRVIGAWSRIVGSDARRVGPDITTGGGTSASTITLILGARISTPPGACGSATACPITSSTDSRSSAASRSTSAGSSTTTWISPRPSRTSSNDTRLSRRRWWNQPATCTTDLPARRDHLTRFVAFRTSLKLGLGGADGSHPWCHRTSPAARASLGRPRRSGASLSVASTAD